MCCHASFWLGGHCCWRTAVSAVFSQRWTPIQNQAWLVHSLMRHAGSRSHVYGIKESSAKLLFSYTSLLWYHPSSVICAQWVALTNFAPLRSRCIPSIQRPTCARPIPTFWWRIRVSLANFSLSTIDHHHRCFCATKLGTLGRLDIWVVRTCVYYGCGYEYFDSA